MKTLVISLVMVLMLVGSVFAENDILKLNCVLNFPTPDNRIQSASFIIDVETSLTSTNRVWLNGVLKGSAYVNDNTISWRIKYSTFTINRYTGSILYYDSEHTYSANGTCSKTNEQKF